MGYFLCVQFGSLYIGNRIYGFFIFFNLIDCLILNEFNLSPKNKTTIVVLLTFFSHYLIYHFVLERRIREHSHRFPCLSQTLYIHECEYIMDYTFFQLLVTGPLNINHRAIKINIKYDYNSILQILCNSS